MPYASIVNNGDAAPFTSGPNQAPGTVQQWLGAISGHDLDVGSMQVTTHYANPASGAFGEVHGAWEGLSDLSSPHTLPTTPSSSYLSPISDFHTPQELGSPESQEDAPSPARGETTPTKVANAWMRFRRDFQAAFPEKLETRQQTLSRVAAGIWRRLHPAIKQHYEQEYEWAKEMAEWHRANGNTSYNPNQSNYFQTKSSTEQKKDKAKTPTKSPKLDPESEKRRVNFLVELVAKVNPLLVGPPRPPSARPKKASPKQKKASFAKKGSGRAQYPRSPSLLATHHVPDPFGVAGPSYAPSGFGGLGAYAPHVSYQSNVTHLTRPVTPITWLPIEMFPSDLPTSSASSASDVPTFSPRELSMPIPFSEFSSSVAPPPATAEPALYDRQPQGMGPVTARSEPAFNMDYYRLGDFAVKQYIEQLARGEVGDDTLSSIPAEMFDAFGRNATNYS